MSDLASIPNPFRDHVVRDAWQSPADVEEIHRSAFQACLDGIDSASRGQPDSVLVYGSPGSGKTHLLTRLQRYLVQTAAQAPDRVLKCVFVYVRLDTTPQLLWSHLRRVLARELMREDQGLTQLQRLVAHQIGGHNDMAPHSAAMRVRVSIGADPEELTRYLTTVSSKLGLPRDLEIMLDHLVHRRSTRDAAAWLAGDSLPERILEKLDVGGDVSDDREGAAKETVLGLSRLAAETLPIVFCFDQVEALLRSYNDTDAFFRFGRLAADLAEADPNVFVITCLQSAQLKAFSGAVLEADRDRFAKRRIELDPLKPEEVERLVLSRLHAAEPLRALREARPAEPLFPFNARFLRQLKALEPCVPRRVLAACATQLEELQHGTSVKVPHPTFLTSELDQRTRAEAERLGPGETRATLVRGAEVLQDLNRASVVARDLSVDGAEIDLVLQPPEGRQKVAISVRDEVDGRSLRPRLAALVKQFPRPDGARLVLVRDPRTPLPQRAVKAQEHLAELRAKGATVVEPLVEALAALSALSSLLADAKSGDLANDGETIDELTVRGWLRQLTETDEARMGSLVRLTDDLLTPPERSHGKDAEPSPVDLLQQKLAERVARDKVVFLHAAAAELSISPSDLAVLVSRTPQRYLLLQGPPAALLHVAGVVEELGDAR